MESQSSSDVSGTVTNAPVTDIVVSYVFMRQSAQEIATRHQLPLSKVHAALAYYYEHQAEIDAKIDIAAIRQQLRQLPNVAKDQSQPIENKQVSAFTRSALVIGWVVQVWLAAFLTIGILLAIRAGISLVFRDIGLDNDMADLVGKLGSNLVMLIGIFTIGMAWKKRQKIQALFTSFHVILLLTWLIGEPILDMFLQTIGINKDIEFYASTVVWVLFILLISLAYEAYRRQLKKAHQHNDSKLSNN